LFLPLPTGDQSHDTSGTDAEAICDPPDDALPPLLDGNDSDDEPNDGNDHKMASLPWRHPHFTTSMTPRQSDKFIIGKA
jgi:hypothetical protein